MHWNYDVSAPWDYISYAVYPSNQSIKQSYWHEAKPSAISLLCVQLFFEISVIAY